METVMSDVSAAQREAIAEAIDGTLDGFCTCDPDKAADAVLVLVEAWLAGAVQAERERAIGVIRDFPLNICGDGSPMPRDYAATVEQFREAVLAVVSRDTRSSGDGN